MKGRPKTIADVAARSASLRDVSFELSDFLHEFQREGAPESLADEPALLRDRFAEGAIADAYLAATAATLALRIGGDTPRWTWRPERFLKRPWFAAPGSSMRACLLLESPSRFRERNLFVTSNALDVA